MDIAGNSVKAGATIIDIVLKAEMSKKMLQLIIKDNGYGMDEELVKNVTDPFVSTRNTRKVGMGLPLLEMNARKTGGNMIIDSVPGKGTRVVATFVADHIDCIPIGDIAGTISLLISGNPKNDFVVELISDKGNFKLDSREVKQELDGLAIWRPEIISFLKELVQENINHLEIV